MKKTEVITFRTNENIKAELDQIAKEKEWSVSQVVEKICREYFEKKERDKIDN